MDFDFECFMWQWKNGKSFFCVFQAALLLKRQQNSVPEDELDLGGDSSMADLIGDALNLEKWDPILFFNYQLMHKETKLSHFADFGKVRSAPLFNWQLMHERNSGIHMLLVLEKWYLVPYLIDSWFISKPGILILLILEKWDLLLCLIDSWCMKGIQAFPFC